MGSVIRPDAGFGIDFFEFPVADFDGEINLKDYFRGTITYSVIAAN